MKKKPTSSTKRAPTAPRFGPHPNDAHAAREAFDDVRRGKFLSEKETYALLDEALGEKFPRPSK